MDYSDINRVLMRLKDFYMKRFQSESYKISIVSYTKKTTPDENLDDKCMLIFSAGDYNKEDVVGTWTVKHSRDEVINILLEDAEFASMLA